MLIMMMIIIALAIYSFGILFLTDAYIFFVPILPFR